MYTPKHTYTIVVHVSFLPTLPPILTHTNMLRKETVKSTMRSSKILLILFNYRVDISRLLNFKLPKKLKSLNHLYSIQVNVTTINDVITRSYLAGYGNTCGKYF